MRLKTAEIDSKWGGLWVLVKTAERDSEMGRSVAACEDCRKEFGKGEDSGCL